MVYINEAHAMDVWPIGESAGTINYSHKNLEDRKFYALKFKNEFQFELPIYLDNMQDEFENKLASWPFRYYILRGNKFEFIPDPSDSWFDITELFARLD